MPLAVKVFVHDASDPITSNDGTISVFSKHGIIIVFVVIINHNLLEFFTWFYPFRIIFICLDSISLFKAFKGI